MWPHTAEAGPLPFIGRPVSAQRRARAALWDNNKIATLTTHLHHRHGMRTLPTFSSRLFTTFCQMCFFYCYFNNRENRAAGGSVSVREVTWWVNCGLLWLPAHPLCATKPVVYRCWGVQDEHHSTEMSTMPGHSAVRKSLQRAEDPPSQTECRAL